MSSSDEGISRVRLEMGIQSMASASAAGEFIVEERAFCRAIRRRWYWK